MSGWVKDYRSLWDHPLFAKEPMTEREAWRWLCSFARHDAGLTRFKSSVINLERGQLIASRNRLAREWMWTERKVRTFLKLLVSQDMIKLETDQGVTKLTVCNYDLFQGERPEADQQVTSERPASDQQVTTNKNGKKGKNVKKEKVCAPTGALFPDRFDEFWDAFADKRDRENAEEAWAEAIKRASPDEIIEGAKRYRRWMKAQGDKAPTRKMAQGWLNDSRWKDELHINGARKLTPEEMAGKSRTEIMRMMGAH